MLDDCPQSSLCRACEARLKALESNVKLKLVGQRLRTAVEQYSSTIVLNRLFAELARRV